MTDKLALCDAAGICSFLRQAARFVTEHRDCIKYVTPEELPEPAEVMMTLFVLLAHQQKQNYGTPFAVPVPTDKWHHDRMSRPINQYDTTVAQETR